MLNELAKEIHEAEVERGYWDVEHSVEDIVAACHAHLSFALINARRVNWWPVLLEKEAERALLNDPHHKIRDRDYEYRMVECLYRILDDLGRNGYDVDALLQEKLDVQKKIRFNPRINQ